MKFHLSNHQTQISEKKPIHFSNFWPNTNILLQLGEIVYGKSGSAEPISYQHSPKTWRRSSPVRLKSIGSQHCKRSIAKLNFRIGDDWFTNPNSSHIFHVLLTENTLSINRCSRGSPVRLQLFSESWYQIGSAESNFNITVLLAEARYQRSLN